MATPTSTAALPDATTQPAAGVSDSALPPADATVAEIRRLIPDVAKGSNADDVAALAAFYEELSGPTIWVTTDGLTAKGKAAIEEIGKADDWGLRASDFDVPHLASGTLTPEAAGGSRDQDCSGGAQVCALCARRPHQPCEHLAAHGPVADAEGAQVGPDRDRSSRCARRLSALASSQARAVPAPAPGASEAARRLRREGGGARGGSGSQRQASARAAAQGRHGGSAGRASAQAPQGAGRRPDQGERLRQAAPGRRGRVPARRRACARMR